MNEKMHISLCMFCKHCKHIDVEGEIYCDLGIKGKMKIYCVYFELKETPVPFVKGGKGE